MYNLLRLLLKQVGYVPPEKPAEPNIPNYHVLKEEDRNHHWWKKVDTVAVDIYKDGKIVVIVREPDGKETILECN